MDWGTFFQLGPIPSSAMQGSYNWYLVVLSYAIASLAAFIALDITERIRTLDKQYFGTRLWWLVCGALAMGCGIWTMHFIGMMAFKMDMPMDYDPGLTILSMVIAIIASGFAFFLIMNPIVKIIRMTLGGVLLGLGIASMHYTGMWAMSGVQIHYLPSLFILSIVIAIITSETALALMIAGSNKVFSHPGMMKMLSALIMGLAICGMHYTGMDAAIFTPGQVPISKASHGLTGDSLALFIAFITIVITGIALLASRYWMRLLMNKNQQLMKTEAILEKNAHELQRLNEDLQQSIEKSITREQKIQAILEAAADGILVMNEQGIIEQCNQAAENILGFATHEIETQSITKFLGKVSPTQKWAAYPWNVLCENNLSTIELTGRCKDHRLIPIELTLSKSFLEEKIFYIMIFRDIRERREAEQHLAALHEQLVNTARVAGMAEVATCVLHNVGNVLNSINVSAKILLERDGKEKLEGLQKLSTLLKENEGNLDAFFKHHPVGQKIPVYLKQFAEYCQNEWNFSQKELESLNKKVMHVKAIVAMQQSLSGGSATKGEERVDINRLMDDALSMNSETIDNHHIVVRKEYANLPQVSLDKVKTLQILVNLIKNAIESIREQDPDEKILTLRTAERKPDSVVMEVIDNGKGIRAENLTSIFNYGFTTRKEGHGFGLHSSAMAAQQSGGSLKAYSAGPSKGAKFTLCLPLKAELAKVER